MASRRLISEFIENAKTLGLATPEISNAEVLLSYKEYGLAFDTVITQLYEAALPINQTFYEEVVYLAERMDFTEDNYVFLKELVK